MALLHKEQGTLYRHTLFYNHFAANLPISVLSYYNVIPLTFGTRTTL